MKLIAFDIETWGLKPGYTLQPWRTRSAESGVLSIAAYDGKTPTISSWCPPAAAITHTVDSLSRGEKSLICGWNLKFDLSYLLASGLSDWVYSHRYIDGMLLLKRVVPGLRTYALKATLKEYSDIVKLKSGYENAIEFKIGDPLEVYSAAEQREMLRYNALDAMYTQRLVAHLLTIASKADINQAIKESAAALLFADSWQRGINIDTELLQSYEDSVANKLTTLQDLLAKHKLAPKMIRSTKQLPEFLQNELKIKLTARTDSGGYATDKKTLSNLYYTCTGYSKQVLRLILKYRELQTEQDKFVKSFKDSTKESDLIHPDPLLHSTYTGRLTYKKHQIVTEKVSYKNGNTRDVRRKLIIGVPIHQMKKKGLARQMFIAPEGHDLVELDFAAQEMRIMACIANETTMIKLFNENTDLHAYTAAGIIDVPHRTFLDWKETKPEEYTKARFLGKLTNLSLQYRLSAKSLHKQWHDVYGLVDKSESDAIIARQAYLQLYPKIAGYWDSSINFAKQNGYAQNLAGKKHPLRDWSFDEGWKSSQTAINYPVQSTGAEQKILAIYCLKDFLRSNNIQLAWDLHDGLYFYVPHNEFTKECVAQMVEILENLPYEKSWGTQPQVRFPVEAKIGKSWGTLKVLKI